MLKVIIKLANIYDKLGDNLKADALDSFANKYVVAGKEPTPTELFEEESWIQEDIDDPTKDLFGDDLMTAKLYLDGHNPDDIPELLKQLKSQQQEILMALSKLVPGSSQIDALPKQQPIIPEASVLNDFQKLANLLDQNKLFKSADKIDSILFKAAQGLPPDDDDFDDLDEFELDDLDDLPEPDTDELLDMEKEHDDFFYQALQFIQILADGNFKSLSDAQMEAQDLLKQYDQAHNIKDVDFQNDEPIETLPDNIIPFKN